MKHRRSTIALGILSAILLVGLFISTSADSTAINFESGFATGTVHTQNGWSSLGAAGLGCAVYDHAIVDNTGAVYSYPTFGTYSLRISNAVGSGCFGDQTFSKSLVDEAGETAATSGVPAQSGGTRQKHFEAQFDIASTLPTDQRGWRSLLKRDQRRPRTRERNHRRLHLRSGLIRVLPRLRASLGQGHPR